MFIERTRAGGIAAVGPALLGDLSGSKAWVAMERNLLPPGGDLKWREIEGKRYYIPSEVCDTIGKEWFCVEGDKARPDDELLGMLTETW